MTTPTPTSTRRLRSLVALLALCGAFAGSATTFADSAHARGMLNPCQYDTTCPPPPPPR